MPEREALLIPEPPLVQPEVLAETLHQVVIATVEVLQEIGNPIDRELAYSPSERLPA